MALSSGTRRRGWYVTAALAAAALAIAGCGSSGKSTSSASGGVKSGGTITYALDEDVAGFNVNQADDTEFVLQEILNNTLPSVYNTNASLAPVLESQFVTSAKVTSTSPETVVYQINPKAVWSDGVPITADDFVYNWQAQSGNPKYTDVGGKAYQPANTAGYSDIASVTGSNNGKTVTVVFAKPFGDWESLFGNILPAHIAQKVGFNDGFQTFGPAVQVSGGPYEIKSYAKGQDLVEVRNPKWWGTPGKLSQITFRFILDDSQQPPAIQNGEVNMVNPALASTDFYDSVKSIPNFTTSVDAGLEFQHIDFNEANPYLAKTAIRQAMVLGTNRQDMVNRIVGPLTTKIGPLQNRIYVPNQTADYKNTSGSLGTFDPSKAKALLTSSGLGTYGSDGYFQPNYGPEKGKDLTLNISTTSGVQVRAQLEELFQSYMKAIGIKINVKNYDANTLFSTVGPKGTFDIIEFAWVSTPFPSGNQSIYCSYTDTNDCGQNWDHYANPQVDQLFDQAIGTTDPAQAAPLYNQIDSILWQDAVTLPLFQEPVLTGWSSNYANVIPNPSSVGVTWNAPDWGLKAS